MKMKIEFTGRNTFLRFTSGDPRMIERVASFAAWCEVMGQFKTIVDGKLPGRKLLCAVNPTMKTITCLIIALTCASVCQAATEKENDDHVWRICRQILVDFGFTNKVAAFDAMYVQATTPTACDAWEDQRSIDVARIAEDCGTNDLPAVLRAVTQHETNCATVFAGLMHWTEHGGVPTLRGSDHLALHFIYGGAAEIVCEGGYFAAVWKETRDFERGGAFNFDQMNAAIQGADCVRAWQPEGTSR